MTPITPLGAQLEEFKKKKQAALAKKHQHPGSDLSSPEKDGTGSVGQRAGPHAPPGLARAPATLNHSEQLLPQGEPISAEPSYDHAGEPAVVAASRSAAGATTAAAAGTAGHGSQEAEALREQVGQLLESVDQLHRSLQVKPSVGLLSGSHTLVSAPIQRLRWTSALHGRLGNLKTCPNGTQLLCPPRLGTVILSLLVYAAIPPVLSGP
jgi:hypothetical protein